MASQERADDEGAPPLVVWIELTEEQRTALRDLTGIEATRVYYSSDAPSIRVRFAGLQLEVDRGVYVPTPVTEDLVHTALRLLVERKHPVLIDVGTGSGAVALSLGAGRADGAVYGTDTSEQAVSNARRNRRHLKLPNVRFYHGALLEPLAPRLRRRAAAIVGNLPYMPPVEAAGVRGWWAPAGTYFGEDSDGLGLLRRLAEAARDLLEPGGRLVLQLADFQWDGFAGELLALGYDSANPEVRQPGGAIVASARWSSEGASAGDHGLKPAA